MRVLVRLRCIKEKCKTFEHLCLFSVLYHRKQNISGSEQQIFFFFLHYFITELKTDQRITKIISSIINKGNNQLQLWGCCLGDTWWENSNACHITPWRSDSRAGGGGVWAGRGRWWVGAEVELRSKKYKKRKQPLSIPRHHEVTAVFLRPWWPRVPPLRGWHHHCLNTLYTTSYIFHPLLSVSLSLFLSLFLASTLCAVTVCVAVLPRAPSWDRYSFNCLVFTPLWVKSDLRVSHHEGSPEGRRRCSRTIIFSFRTKFEVFFANAVGDSYHRAFIVA